jgi:hypothetical protein
MHHMFSPAALDRWLETPKKSVKPRATRITLWRPEIGLEPRPDDVLRATLRQVTSLMEERGLR